MVFSTSASAFLHLNEHQLELTHADLTYADHQTDSGVHEEHDASAEHAHHFNLHITADLIEHEAIRFIKSANHICGDVMSPLITRSYTPPSSPAQRLIL